jgi:ElaB/YqjD/DUF883 family membrane-anchored ribosome-binding protein
METKDLNVVHIGKISEEPAARKPSTLDKVQNYVADKLSDGAQALAEKATDPQMPPEVAAYEKHAARLLEGSADYVRAFDYQKTEQGVRDYVGNHPVRSLVIAGIAGLVIGSIIRRR